MATMRGTKLRSRRILAARPLGSQDDSAGDFAFAQQIQRLVGFSKRPLNHMAAYLPGGCHGEYFPQVLPSTDPGCMAPDFSCCHQNRRETDVFSGQAHDEPSTGGPEAGKSRVISCLCGGGNK